jgi:hypothetical protein
LPVQNWLDLERGQIIYKSKKKEVSFFSFFFLNEYLINLGGKKGEA